MFGAAEHNLGDVDVSFGPGLTAIVGVSGSGKSSLLVDTIALALSRPDANVPDAGVVRVQPGAHDSISGAPARTIVADQSRGAVTSAGMFLGLVDAVR